jgi:hypothetical protein
MIEIQGEQFVAPIREKVYQPPAFQQVIHIEIEYLGNTASRNTGIQLRQSVIQNKLSFDLNRGALLAAVEFPGKGPAGGRVAKEQTFVIFGLQFLGSDRFSATLDIRRRGAG